MTPGDKNQKHETAFARVHTMGITAVHLALLALSLFGLGYFFLSSGTFFASDTGLRFLQIRELLRQDWQSLSVTYPGQFLDPELRFIPYYYAYAIINNQIYLSISPFFPLLAAFFYDKLGMAGLPVVPMLGGLATAVGVYALCQSQKVVRGRLAMWTTVFATPIVFYSVTLWDHTLASACAIWSLTGISYGWHKKAWWPVLLGGMAAGLGAGQRPEMYVFIIALGLSALIVFWKQWTVLISVGIGVILSLTAVWWTQYRWYGHPLGMPTAHNLFGYGAVSYTAQSYSGIPIPQVSIAGKFLGLAESGNLLHFGAFLFVILTIFLVALGLRNERVNWIRAGWVCGVAGYGLCVFFGLQGFMVGILPTFPLLALSLSLDPQQAADSKPISRLVLSVSLLFLGLMFTLWPAFGGLQWGARYLLAVYPLLLYLAFQNFSDFSRRPGFGLKKELRVTAVTLLAFSLLIQAAGLYNLYQQHAEQIRVKSFLTQSTSPVIVTNSPFLPTEMSFINEKLFFYVADEADLEELLLRLWQYEMTDFIFLPLAAETMSVPTHFTEFRVHQLDRSRYELVSP